MKKNKKYFIIGTIILLIIIIIVLINILHLDTLKCQSSIKEDAYNISYKHTIYYKKNNVKKVLIERTVESKNNTILSFFENNYQDEFKNNAKNYGSYTIKKSTIKDHKLNIIVEVDFSKVKMSKLKEKNSYLKEDIKKNNLTLDGAYKLFQLNKKNCK